MSIFISDKSKCCGCEACAQICNSNAITMKEDSEGFSYPIVNSDLCIDCGLCESICQYTNPIDKHKNEQRAFGGHINNAVVLNESTSGGAFSAIVDFWCDKDYVIFGAEAKGLKVFHSYITDKKQLYRYRRSKYSQSEIGSAYIDANRFLKEGKKVLFSGTPCQLAGLKLFLGKGNFNHLLMVEVVCEGVPSPLFIRKLDNKIQEKKNSKIDIIDYRYKDTDRWDYQVMFIKYSSHNNSIHGTFKQDRWFNGFWSIWLNHLMSRPSCYNCLYTTKERVADLTLGDLWGVHLYCPDLYNSNRGASLIIANTKKGISIAEAILNNGFIGRELDINQALRYQGPMRKSIPMNPQRGAFMTDLKSSMDYDTILKKWAKPSSFKLLVSKYVWGSNRQVVNLWKCKQFFNSKKNK